MLREPIEMYPQDNFEQDAHIAEILHTSAVYLGVNTDQVTALYHRAWQPSPASLSREAQNV